jgi:outer membrane cobalamin receptor
MLTMKMRVLITVLALSLVCGCGYTARSLVPEGDASVHVENFKNKIDITREASYETVYYPYVPGLESDVTKAIIDRFIFDGNYQIRDAQNAHFLLRGDLVDFRREPLRYDANDNVTEYRITIAVDMELYDLHKEDSVWKEKNFAGESTYRITGEFATSESVAVKASLEDLARRVVERTVEDW